MVRYYPIENTQQLIAYKKTMTTQYDLQDALLIVALNVRFYNNLKSLKECVKRIEANATPEAIMCILEPIKALTSDPMTFIGYLYQYME